MCFKSGVDRYQIIGAVQLDAMASVINDGNICATRPACKVAQRFAKLCRRKVELRLDRVEVCRLEHGSERCRVIRRVGETRDFLIGRIADDQGNALFSQRRTTAEKART